ncbi:MAG: dTDP-4-dehydrorhamnose 3,5-epimerase family protein [Acidobacteria bacterium]|nr:dTDP-4-dehydrorhamnose 3,5-epimerase family protein [Acidobacteriota bacterium]
MTGLEGARSLGERHGLRLAVRPRPARDAGILIRQPDSADLIKEMRIERVQLWPDDRGYFLEVMRQGMGLGAELGADSLQVSCALSYPGTIKALHYHFEQTDLWAAAQGQLQVCLYDLREDSPTFGSCNTLFIGTLQPWQLLIPPGVGHGYKVIGPDPAVLVYVTNRFYNPADEGRLPYNDSGLNYDWETQHK